MRRLRLLLKAKPIRGATRMQKSFNRKIKFPSVGCPTKTPIYDLTKRIKSSRTTGMENRNLGRQIGGRVRCCRRSDRFVRPLAFLACSLDYRVRARTASRLDDVREGMIASRVCATVRLRAALMLISRAIIDHEMRDVSSRIELRGTLGMNSGVDQRRARRRQTRGLSA